MRAYRKVDDHYELRIDGGRLALLGVGASLAVVLVFLLGVLVGKTLWGGRRVPPVASAEAPPGVEAPAVGAAPEPSRELTFYHDLKRPDAPAAGPEPGAPAPASGEPMVETPVAPRPEVAPLPEQAAAARDEALVGRPAPAPAPARAAGPPPAARAEPRLPQPVFTVQVGSFRDRASADDLVRRISGQGVSAEVVAAPVAGRTWYRVQVGRFDARAEAEALYRNTLRPKGVQGFVTTR